jgi:hypothetical protein
VLRRCALSANFERMSIVGVVPGNGWRLVFSDHSAMDVVYFYVGDDGSPVAVVAGHDSGVEHFTATMMKQGKVVLLAPGR